MSITANTPIPLNDDNLVQLESLLSSLPAPLQPLDLSALDGFLCGVLLQPRQPPVAQWWPFVIDTQGRPAPAGPATQALQQLVLRRHAELDQAIGQRQWFDPWILSAADEPADAGDGDDPQSNKVDDDEENELSPEVSDALLPWVAGFAAAMEHFPQLMDSDHPELVEPLAVLFMHFDPADLEDADALLAMIETLEPPATLADAVQDLVRALMLIADVTRPVAAARPKPGGLRQRPTGARRPANRARNRS